MFDVISPQFQVFVHVYRLKQQKAPKMIQTHAGWVTNDAKCLYCTCGGCIPVYFQGASWCRVYTVGATENHRNGQNVCKMGRSVVKTIPKSPVKKRRHICPRCAPPTMKINQPHTNHTLDLLNNMDHPFHNLPLPHSTAHMLYLYFPPSHDLLFVYINGLLNYCFPPSKFSFMIC